MRLLIIGNINSSVKAAIDIAQAKQVKVLMVEEIATALVFLRKGRGADLILVDVKFDIALLITSMKQEHISTPVVAYGVACSAKDAVMAIKFGAKEFLPLPPEEKLMAAIFAAIASDAAKLVIGNSPAMQAVIKIADKIASTSASILITGKSGTGKEVLASYIHHIAAERQSRLLESTAQRFRRIY